eukprot:c15256_g1_i1.p1 GENE.c15256_g1_i1~~c15256_g1_i1.p1  ORF type:complete len:475 (-),score=123.40 c15256_g1_i1:31-1455(-)
MDANQNRVVQDANKTFPIRFTWKAEWGGCDVNLVGDFNNWQQTVNMRKEGDDGDFHVVLDMAQGKHMVKYIVDGVWRLAPNQPTIYDGAGNMNNVVVVDASLCRRKSYQKFDARVSRMKMSNDAMVHPVLKYVEHEIGATTFDPELTGPIPESVTARPFDVILSPEATSPEEFEASKIARISSYNVLVDMTLDRYTRHLPTADQTFADRIRLGIQDAIVEQTATLLQQARHQLKTPRERAVRFNLEDTHPDLSIDDCGLMLTKMIPGMYRSARTTQHVHHSRPTFFEATFKTQSKSGGICVGVSMRECSLHALVGTSPKSIGLYSTGDIVCEGEWVRYTRPFVQGTVVGVLVTLVPFVRQSDSIHLPTSVRVVVRFLLNGVDCGPVPCDLIVPADALLFPTVTLYTSKTQVSLQGVGVDLTHAGSVLDLEPNAVTLDCDAVSQDIADRCRSLSIASCGPMPSPKRLNSLTSMLQ